VHAAGRKPVKVLPDFTNHFVRLALQLLLMDIGPASCSLNPQSAACRLLAEYSPPSTT
jgi:hypothetical protein